jgi:hypothetical protein
MSTQEPMGMKVVTWCVSLWIDDGCSYYDRSWYMIYLGRCFGSNWNIKENKRMGHLRRAFDVFEDD